MKKHYFFSLLMFFALIGSVFAQERTITGTVTSAEDETSLPGVNVRVTGTTVGTITDVNGEYSIDVPESATTLSFSFVGMRTQEVAIGTSNVLNINLVPELQELDEVVITALGISKEKKALGYSVTEIGSEDLSTVKETNVINSLSGRVAGVVLTESPSGPGGGTRVVIRGNNSLRGNNQPLYVVDGVPIDNSGFGSANGTGTANYRRDDYGTGISDINPDDIESISVLKGPNAAALYGSRASNGVILITTKKGKKGKGVGVTYSTSLTFENPLLLPKFQNEYGQGSMGNYYTDVDELKNYGSSWGGKIDGQSHMYWTGENRTYTAQEDNVKDFFRTGSTFINTLAMEAGNENSSVRFSYTNNDANSILPNAGLVKHNFNIRALTDLSDKLSIDTKVTYFNQQSSNRPFHGTEGVMAYVYDIPRNLDITDLEDYQNEEDYSVNTYTSGTNGNPYWVVNHDVNEDSRDRIMGFAKVNYEFTDWLSAFVRVGTDVVSHKIETVNQYGHWFYGSGRFNYSTRKTSETNADFLFMFDKDFGSDLRISGIFGGNHMYETYEYQGVSGEDLKIPTKPTVASAGLSLPGYTPLREKMINSLYGSASISYRGFVYLDLSGRNDWSSTLPEDNWSYFYPSASLSVLLNDFIDPDANMLDFLKARGSWAKVGSDTSPYQLDIAFNLQQQGYLGLTTLSRPSVRMNTDLKPEQTISTEFGVEARFLGNRVYTDISYYQIESSDLIMDVPVPAATGYSQFRSNVGKVSNKGIEILVGGIPVQAADFEWDISFNISHNKNTLDELIEGLTHFTFSTTNSGNIVVQATVKDEEENLEGGFGDIYGTDWLKNDNGDIVVDAQGRPLATSEKVYLGNYQPDWVGGISNRLSYKGITLRGLIDIRVGGQIFSGTDASLDASGVSEKTLEYREEGITVDGVVNTGTTESPVYETNTVEITGQQYWGSYAGIASNYIYDQTYVKLRELSLSYQLPRNVFENTFIQSVSVGLIGRNLAFLYKDLENFDPISSYSTSNFAQGILYFTLPTTRSIGFNVNVKF